MFGPGEQQHALLWRQVAIVRHELRLAGECRFDDRMSAGADQESIVVGDLRTAPGACFGELRRGLGGVQQRQSISAGGERIGVGQRHLHKVIEHHPLARGGPLAGLSDAPIEIR